MKSCNTRSSFPAVIRNTEWNSRAITGTLSHCTCCMMLYVPCRVIFASLMCLGLVSSISVIHK